MRVARPSGLAVADDLVKFRQALDSPGVDSIVFVNSPGGDLWTALTVGRLIADRALNTIVAGYCVSACSILFMGGKERTFSDVFRPARTFVGIHGSHNKDSKSINASAQPQIYAFFRQRMGERFNAEVMNKALYEMNDAGAMLRVYDAQRQPARSPVHCRASQTARKDCTEFKGMDALSLGIVTASGLTPVTLPPALTQGSSILGRELTQEIADAPAYFEQLAAAQCASDNCRKLVADHAAGKLSKGLATPVGGQGGVSISRDQDTAMQAFVRAIYACNHVADRPARLCESRTVNGFEVHDLYALGSASHAAALAKLEVPAQKYYGNEEFGGGMTRAEGLRTQTMVDITPQQLEDVKTYGTQELARALKGANAPVVIDVRGGSNDVLPGAVTLLGAGLALEDTAADGRLQSRIAGLLKKLSPDVEAPVVFYCDGRECWHSANAALRARRLGFTNVGWYRGGLLSWKAANLPVALLVLRAVAN